MRFQFEPLFAELALYDIPAGTFESHLDGLLIYSFSLSEGHSGKEHLSSAAAWRGTGGAALTTMTRREAHTRAHLAGTKLRRRKGAEASRSKASLPMLCRCVSRWSLPPCAALSRLAQEFAQGRHRKDLKSQCGLTTLFTVSQHALNCSQPPYVGVRAYCHTRAALQNGAACRRAVHTPSVDGFKS